MTDDAISSYSCVRLLRELAADVSDLHNELKNTKAERQALTVACVEWEKEYQKLHADWAGMRLERDVARSNARILAHAYEHDSRPPERVVREALAYPVRGEDGET